MNWEAFWDEQSAATDAAAQVGRIQAGSNPALPRRIAEHIGQCLQLSSTDRLLDVCCGNGTLTALLAPNCQSVLGVDLSAMLIQKAKQSHQLSNLHFVKADAKLLSGIGGSFHKISLYFSFQYFENYEDGLRVLAEMNSLLLPGGRIFIGDTPDKRRWWKYYNTPVKWLRYCYQKWRNKEPMGKFWHPDEFVSMAKAVGLEVEIMAEPIDLPYAWYRFDAVFSKPIH
jgi:ubiquinone/menaquinone biosynthesis C-methylase UbiE